MFNPSAVGNSREGPLYQPDSRPMDPPALDPKSSQSFEPSHKSLRTNLGLETGLSDKELSHFLQKRNIKQYLNNLKLLQLQNSAGNLSNATPSMADSRLRRTRKVATNQERPPPSSNRNLHSKSQSFTRADRHRKTGQAARNWPADDFYAQAHTNLYAPANGDLDPVLRGGGLQRQNSQSRQVSYSSVRSGDGSLPASQLFSSEAKHAFNNRSNPQMYNTFHGKGLHGQFFQQPLSNLTSLYPTATASRQDDLLMQRYS